MSFDEIRRDFTVIRGGAAASSVSSRRVYADRADLPVRAFAPAVAERELPLRSLPFPADAAPWNDDYLLALGDAKVEWREGVAADGLVMRTYRVSGRHDRSLLGVAPTGRRVSFSMYSARTVATDGSSVEQPLSPPWLERVSVGDKEIVLASLDGLM